MSKVTQSNIMFLIIVATIGCMSLAFGGFCVYRGSLLFGWGIIIFALIQMIRALFIATESRSAAKRRMGKIMWSIKDAQVRLRDQDWFQTDVDIFEHGFGFMNGKEHCQFSFRGCMIYKFANQHSTIAIDTLDDGNKKSRESTVMISNIKPMRQKALASILDDHGIPREPDAA